MSYSGRKNFKTAREKNARAFKNMKVALMVILLFLVIFAIMNRVSIKDYLATYFY